MSVCPWSHFHSFFHLCLCICMSVLKSAPALSNQDAFSYWFRYFTNRIFWAAETRHALCSAGYLKSKYQGPKQWARLYEYFWKTQPFSCEPKSRISLPVSKGRGPESPRSILIFWVRPGALSSCYSLTQPQGAAKAQPTGQHWWDRHSPRLTCVGATNVLSSKHYCYCCLLKSCPRKPGLHTSPPPPPRTPAPGQPQSGHGKSNHLCSMRNKRAAELRLYQVHNEEQNKWFLKMGL